MKTILDKLLLDYAGTLEIEYLGRRAAKIKFMGRCKLRELEKKILRSGASREGYSFDCIHNFNCNGTWTTATITLLPTSLPFYHEH